MPVKTLKPFLFVIAVIAMVSLACLGGGGTPAPEPEPVVTEAPQEPAEPVVVTVVVTALPTEEEPVPTEENISSGGFEMFTDRNDLYTIEVPADWYYEETVDEEDGNYYIDTFTSPDGGAVIESIVYDDGTKFTGNQKSKFALYLLNTFYSSTGREGDIKVSDYASMEDGSERLIWTSKEGGYSGISFLETRSNGTTFLFFTVDWGNDYEETYLDTLNYVIESYTIP